MTTKEIAEYRAHPGVNWSNLKWMKKSPLDYLVHSKREDDPSDYMKLGTFLDCGLITPEKLKDTYIKVPPIVWNSNDSKAGTVAAYREVLGFDEATAAALSGLRKEDFVSEVESLFTASGKIPIPSGNGSDSEVYTYEKGMRILNANVGKPAWKRLMENMEVSQLPLYAKCPTTNLTLKGLPDIMTKSSLVDLKSIGNLGKMFYNIKTLDYLGQLAYYNYLADLNGISKQSFWIVFVETSSPYKMKFLEIDPREIARQHQTNVELLQQLAVCLEKGEFPDGSEMPEVYEFREDGSGQQAEYLDQFSDEADSLD